MWPEQPNLSSATMPEEERSVCHLVTMDIIQPIISLDRFSKFATLKRVTAWMFRFIKNTRSPISTSSERSPYLTVAELTASEDYWVSVAQRESFAEELRLLKADLPLPKTNRLLPLRPFICKSLSVLWVGGRMNHSKLSYSKMHPMILHGSHPMTKLIIEAEHSRLLHAGPTLLMSSLSRRFHIIGLRKTVRSVIRQCVTCKRHCVKPTN